ncbi:MAG: GNAT family N-acetyltransferase [Pseudomonadota bacterium]|nr:GNAT family N-acetyltransferase [Pseudomonadota bacterium]
MSEFLIRSAESGDLEAIRSIYTVEVLEHSASFEIAVPDIEEMKTRWLAVTKAGLPYRVVEVDGLVSGYAYASPYRPRPGYRYTLENSVYVARQLHRQGLGYALLTDLIGRCEAVGARQLVAVIGDSEHLASIRLHEKAGFRTVGVLQAVGWKFERWIDSVIMQRSLTGADPGSPRQVTQAGPNRRTTGAGDAA